MMQIIAAAAAIGIADVKPPEFPSDFYVGMQQWTVLNKGGAHFQEDGGICCSLKDSTCGLQTFNLGSDVYQYGSKEYVRVGGVIYNYTVSAAKGAPQGIEFAVIPAGPNSSHTYACAQYCPLDHNFFSFVAIGDGLKYDKIHFAGNATMSQKGGERCS